MRYALLDLDELVRMRASGNLTEIAEKAIDEELAARGVASEQREELLQEQKLVQHADREASEGLAPRGLRLFARVIDLLIALAILVLGYLSRDLVPGVMGVLTVSAALAYLFFADALPGGRSPGKRLLGLAVVDATSGARCTITQSLVRNMVLAFLGGIDALFLLPDERRQRLGDKAAGTVVVRAGSHKRAIA